MELIGLSGKKQSGKDTVYQMCNEILGGKTVKLAFADAVKQEVSDATGWPIPIMEKNKDIFRKIYQWWGTDFKRNLIHSEYWVNRLEEHINRWYCTDSRLLIITDVRFLNEASWIKKNGGKLVRISRPSVWDNNEHESEKNLDFYKEWDYTIHNEYDLDFLGYKVEAMLAHFKYDNSNTKPSITKSIIKQSNPESKQWH